MNKYTKAIGTFGPMILAIATLIVGVFEKQVEEEETREICREEFEALMNEKGA